VKDTFRLENMPIVGDRTSLAPLSLNLHRAATPLREERSNDQSSN
jgi:hypothetical protein